MTDRRHFHANACTTGGEGCRDATLPLLENRLIWHTSINSQQSESHAPLPCRHGVQAVADTCDLETVLISFRPCPATGLNASSREKRKPRLVMNSGMIPKQTTGRNHKRTITCSIPAMRTLPFVTATMKESSCGYKTRRAWEFYCRPRWLCQG